MPLPNHERQTLLFEGHVQGVGFRYTTDSIAQQFAVTGFVQNMPDGRVQLVAEGAAEEVARFVSAVETRMAENIRRTLRDRGAATGEFDRFAIRH